MFHLFFVISTGGTDSTWENEQNRTSSLGPRKLNHMDILRDVFTSRISSSFLLIAVGTLFINHLTLFGLGSFGTITEAGYCAPRSVSPLLLSNCY